MTGKDPSGEDWEAGIAVGLDKLAGKNFMDTPEWERFGKYWGDWEEQAMSTAKAFRERTQDQRTQANWIISSNTL